MAEPLGIGARRTTCPRAWADAAATPRQPSPPTTVVTTTTVTPIVEAETSDNIAAAVAADTPPLQQQQPQHKMKIDPLATIVILALRSVVPNAKLVIMPPSIALQRQTTVGRLVRTLCSHFAHGFSQDEYFLLEEPIVRAIGMYLCSATVPLFSMACAGLESLKDCYDGNTAGALSNVIRTIGEALKKPPTQMFEVTSPVLTWTLREVESVTHIISTINSLTAKDQTAWIEAVEQLIAAKFAF